jgi:hypothetical protein
MGSAKRFKLYADYGQIHLCDPSGTQSLEDAWTAQASDDRIADGGNIVGVGAKDTAEVDVSVEVLVCAPADDLSAWDHVTESSLDLASGEAAVLGCTDELARARRFPTAPGTWRVRVSHANLATGRERIRLQLWPSPRRPPRVRKRWAPPARPAAPPGKRIASVKQAVQAALRGETDAALGFLLPRAHKGQFAASVSALQLLAFRGRWREVVPLAMTVIAEPPEAHAGRQTCLTTCELLARAARELANPALLELAHERVTPSLATEALAHLRGQRPAPKIAGAEDHARFAAHASSAATEKQFRGKPHARAAHLMAYAHLHLGLEDEQLALWDPANPDLRFEQATWIADLLARRGDPTAAWDALASRLSAWWPTTIWDVAPLELLTAPTLAPLMTAARCELVLSTPRGDEAR